MRSGRWEIGAGWLAFGVDRDLELVKIVTTTGTVPGSVTSPGGPGRLPRSERDMVFPLEWDGESREGRVSD